MKLAPAKSLRAFSFAGSAEHAVAFRVAAKSRHSGGIVSFGGNYFFLPRRRMKVARE
jgi:hypothetical protein